VLKTQDFKENDKLLWLFTEKLGKVTAIAKGAKKNKSKFFSSTQNFCFGEYVLYKGKNLYNINEVDIIDSFQGLLKDLDTIAYSSYFCELILIALQEEESNRWLFQEFVKGFYLMKNNVVDLEVLARTLELKLLRATGYGFQLENCSICGDKINKSNYLSIQYHGGTCNKCNKVNGISISYGAYNVLKFLDRSPIENIPRISLSDDLKKEIYKILNIFISQNYSKQPKSLEIFNYIKRSEQDE